MNKLHYIPNCWHEQIANIYNLELVTENADILILRDPFDRAIEQTMDFLDSGGEDGRHWQRNQKKKLSRWDLKETNSKDHLEEY